MNRVIVFSSLYFLSNLFFLKGLQAQIIPDSSLPNNSVVRQNNSNIDILQGDKKGSNLFHSFEEFNVSDREIVRFNASSEIANIFSRVTGVNSSTLNGRILSTGNANLLFLNSNGIIFGPNSSLDIGGSFLATTADRVKFLDGVFGSTGSTAVGVGSNLSPVSLVFKNSGSIEVLGRGHDLRFSDPANFITSFPVGLGQQKAGINTSPRASVAFLGSSVLFDGGFITAPSGNIEVAAIEDGVVSLSSLSELSFDYSEVARFGDVSFRNTSLLDTSGEFDSSISVQGRNIDILDTSLLIIGNFGTGKNSSIRISAQDNVVIDNLTNPDVAQRFIDDGFYYFAGLFSLNFGSGNGGNILIDANNVDISRGASITTNTFTPGGSGSIEVNAKGAVRLTSTELFQSIFPSGFTPSLINVVSVGGPVGDIRINSSSLVVEGGVIVNEASGFSPGGNTVINSGDILVRGGLLLDPLSSSVLESSIGAFSAGEGDLGDLTIQTNTLSLLDGGSISYLPGNFSDSGDIDINASESITISGFVPESSLENPVFSGIRSSLIRFNPFFLGVFGLPPVPSGNSGSINVETPNLFLSDGGSIGVTNEGAGVGGDIFIDAQLLNLDSQASITSATTSGTGGNISITSSFLGLNERSQVLASALGEGPGGNVEINSDLIALNNSDILANAELGNGGQIFLTTQGIFSDRMSIISAESDFGLDGTVVIEALQNNLDVFTKEELRLQSTNITFSCGLTSDSVSSFTLPGSGSLPKQPGNLLSQVPLTTARSQLKEITLSAPTYLDPVTGKRIPIIEAQGLLQESDGTLNFSVRVSNSGSSENTWITSNCLRKALEG